MTSLPFNDRLSTLRMYIFLHVKLRVQYVERPRCCVAESEGRVIKKEDNNAGIELQTHSRRLFLSLLVGYTLLGGLSFLFLPTYPTWDERVCTAVLHYSVLR
jgi:hypothetical protein